MQTYTYVSKGKFELMEKPKPVLMHERDAIVKVTLASICSSDLHIKHGSVPRAVTGITVGHEMVGIVEEVGTAVKNVKPGDRVTVNVETFCGECFFCKKGYVNNCTDENGGWALGCRIDGGQAEYVRVPFADQGLNKIPDKVTDRQALFVGDVLATGYWAARISEITEDDTVLIIGAGPTGICTLLSVMLKNPKRIIMCEKDEKRMHFIREHYPEVLTVSPEECFDFVQANTEHGGADVVLEVAGAESTFRLAYFTYNVPANEDCGYICPVCFWENDPFIAFDNEPSDSNHGITLKEAKSNFAKFGACEKEMLCYVRPPRDDEKEIS